MEFKEIDMRLFWITGYLFTLGLLDKIPFKVAFLGIILWPAYLGVLFSNYFHLAQIIK